ncbi:4-(cytidine 5'-diphospho)-2-C-methyl-D-erythritol kinase [Alkaliphilus peptidifermentans]|uniref:4-diphosphocytidyl-2-C-methyl-D-erythritol kinase n=1 Tax=Alkaliphilus peptidifermentans DSM 18978 TaxID=1120976 RepID=A0A1G5KHJ6_9FIRM|nr:4-(cytidine 5'-diphospho)-2-C-methyl-D-erythritol kinase [Alkaliphilus peptidifermentans]SCZ00135.1 4-diphosphocytidyl-2-C-methyl-D-erythritol kinase [Alkaliphilus peptidifermentans DSM 18978]
MNKIQLKSRAKINLSLDVLRKRPDGYHEVEMIMHQIDLFDRVTLINREDNEIKIYTSCGYIPKDSGNIAFKGASLLRDTLGINKGIDIHIEKRIPVAAGLAGGSSNAAAVILGLNRLWNLKLSQNELMELGVKIGADVPFCILGGAALAEGIGQRLTPIIGLKNVWVVISKPSISVSTAEVYGQLNLLNIESKRPNTPLLLKAVESGDIATLAQNMKNVLETVTEENYPIITEIKKKMMEYNAIGSMMSGSGPTVFGIFKNYQRAKSAYEHLSLLYKQTYIVQSFYRRNEDE